MTYFVIYILAAYLVGALPFGLLIPKLYGVADIRKVGSGNVGATNVYRACGASGALIVTILDIAKGAVPVLVARAVYGGDYSIEPEYFRLAVGFAAILGHIFPPYLKFRGGKGVNTALGVFLTLIPIPTVIALLSFIIVVAITRYVSLGSIVAAGVLFGVILLMRYGGLGEIHPVYVPTGFAIFLLILLTHRANLGRLFHGHENRFSFKRSEHKEARENG